ncbi:MAG: Holliday junction resolvase RuvX [Dehalococcoidia bacterium]|nr:Holliday junction resolvase RuvX [Dehalococcoidia bacterium]MSQ34637.1 Holliday junction resolvase RuvX [Dehalococcoidia bacterium]
MLGLDLGEVRIGIAISDPTGILCTPLSAISRAADASDIRLIVDLAHKEGAVGIVVGLPVTMEGRRGTQAQAALRYCDALKKATTLPIATWDERLSSVEAQALLRDAGRKPSRNKGSIDSAAAALILEAFLTKRR